MKKFICLITLLLIFGNQLRAQSQWSRIYGGDKGNCFYKIIPANGGGYLLAGYTGSYGEIGNTYQGTANSYIVKTDSLGRMIWQITLGATGFEWVKSLVQVAGGDIYVLGTIREGSYDDMFVAKLNAVGSLIWFNNYGSVGYHDLPGGIVADGNDVIVSGTINSSNSSMAGADVTLFKVNSLGAIMWSKTFGTSQRETGNGLCRLSDGSLLICGAYGIGTSGDLTYGYAIRTNGIGDTLWTKTYSGYNFEDCTQLKGDSVIVLVGTSLGLYGNLGVVRINDFGNQLSSYSTSFLADAGVSVKPENDGGFIVSGVYANFGAVAALYKFTAYAGGFLWHRRYFQMGGQSYHTYSYAVDVLPTSDGGYIWVGQTSIMAKTSDDSKAIIIKTDYEGQMGSYTPITPSVSSPDTICTGSTAIVSVPDIYDHYQWFWYNNQNRVYWVPNSDTSSITVDSSRFYRCVMWNDDGVFNVSNNVSVIVSTMPDSVITNVGNTGYCPPSYTIRVKNEPGSAYTWFLNGNQMSGFNLNQISPQVSGNYTVQISNACTTLTTAPFTVNITGLPVYDLGPDTVYMPYYNGASVGCYAPRLSLAHNSTNTYLWYYNGSPTANTNSFYDVPPGSPGYYYVRVQNNCGINYSDTTWVLYDTVYTQLNNISALPLTGCANNFLNLRVDPRFYYSSMYTWFKNGVQVSSSPNGNEYMPGSASTGLDAGYYYCVIQDTCGSVSFSHVTDSIYYSEDNSNKSLFVVGGGSPVSCFGSPVTISANQNGSSYQWYKDSILIPGATQQQYSVTVSGTYNCSITRACGSYFSNNMVVLTGPLTANITSATNSICLSGTDTIKVRIEPLQATGLNTYQWRRNGVIIPGAISDHYDASLSGVYDCLFYFPCSTIVSNSITLNWSVIPNQLYSDNFGKLCSGETVNIHAPSGFSSYQWFRGTMGNSELIPGATDSIYVADTVNYYRVRYNTGTCTVFSEFEHITLQKLPLPNNIMSETPTLSCGGLAPTLLANTRYDLLYQWYRDGLPIGGAVSSDYTASLSGSYQVRLTDSVSCTTLSEPLLVDNSFLSNIQLSTASSSMQCIGDTISIAVIGTYTTYQWYYNNSVIPGATGSSITTDSSGYYSIFVTNASGCAGMKGSLINFVNPPVVTCNVVHTSCSSANGGITLSSSVLIDVSWSGPTNIAPSSGVTSLTSSGLLPGWYYYTYKLLSGNCTFIDSVEIIANTGYPVQINAGTGSVCAGQYINAGAVYPQYLWSSGQTSYSIIPLVSGWYVLTVINTGNGCTGTDSVFVTVNPVPSVNIQPSGPLVLCNGNPAVLDAGLGFAQYLWSNGQATQSAVAFTSGNYIATVTDSNGCINRDTVFVTIQPPPIITTTANGPTSFCVGGSVMLSANGSSGSLQWYRYNIPQIGAIGPNFTATTAGSYRCLVTDAFGCTAFSNPITVTTPCQPPQNPVDKIGDNVSSESGLIIYPNPGENIFELSVNENIIIDDFRIMDVSGRTVLLTSGLVEIVPSVYRFDLSFAKSGVYFIHITDQHKKLHRLKLVKL